MTPPLFDPCEIYRDRLSRNTLMSHGLWYPSAKINIGDVGYIEQGAFKPLFNVTDGQQLKDRECGEPLQYAKTLETFTEAYLKPDVYQNISIEATSLDGGAGVKLLPGPVVEVKLSYQHGSYEGAALYLPYNADKLVVETNQVFPRYMIENFTSWQAYMKRSGRSDGYSNSPALVLVRGYIKAPRWAIVAFKSENKATGGTLVGGFNAAEGRVGWQFSEHHGISKHFNYGPMSRGDMFLTPEADTSSEECIFLSYYKIKYRVFGRWIRTIKMEAGAGPDQLPPPDPEGGMEPGMLSEEYEVQTESPTIPEPTTNLDVLLDYLLIHAPDANAAIACDGDLEELLPNGQNLPERLDEYLESNPPSIAVTADGVASISLEARILSKQRQRRMQQELQGPDPGAGSKRRATSVVEQVTLAGGKQLQGLPVVLTAEAGSSIIWCAISNNGARIATATDNYAVYLWDRSTGQRLAQLDGHQDEVLMVSFSPNGEHLISGASDGKAIIWNLANAQAIKTLDRHTGAIACCTYSPDGTTIATGSFDETVCLWTPEGWFKRSLGPHDAAVMQLAFSPDSTLLASCAEETAYIWECDTGVMQHRLDGHTATIWNICFSHDGGRVVTCGDDATSRVWSVETGAELVTLQEHGEPVWGVAFSPDDQEIASGSYDSTISVCNSFTGENKFTIRERPARVNSVAYSNNGKYLATGDGDSLVKVWNALTGAFVAEFHGHEDKVRTVQWTPDDRALVSCSGDGTVRVWDFLDLLRIL